MATKNDIFREFLKEYLEADKARKGTILTHVTAITKFTRKGAIKRFRRCQLASATDPESRGRPLYYTPDVTAALCDVWDAGGRTVR